jgi:hypothetical protein
MPDIRSHNIILSVLLMIYVVAYIVIRCTYRNEMDGYDITFIGGYRNFESNYYFIFYPLGYLDSRLTGIDSDFLISTGKCGRFPENDFAHFDA